jgi:hypothetical protein
MRFGTVVAICVALGVATTTVVSWACAIRLSPDLMRGRPVATDDAESDGDFLPAVLQRLHERLPNIASDDIIILMDERIGGAERLVALGDPYWHATTGLVYVEFELSQAPVLVVQTRAGWPLPAVKSSQSLMRSATMTQRAVYDRQWMLPVRLRNDFEHRALPLKPLWPGFAINTLLYAAVAWLLLFAPFALRRAARRRRNLCERCGYPRGVSDICSECGAALCAARL